MRVDPAVAVEVAAAYLDAPAPRSPLVEAAYRQLTVETDALYLAATSPDGPLAVQVSYSSCAQPYDTAAELITSVRRDRLLEVTAARFDHDRRHPVFDGVVGGAFDRFRAVHDILGHAWLGAGFDRHGEYATWRFQERFHSALARLALATELHAKHSACWTTGEAPAHKTFLVDPRLLRRSRRLGVPVSRRHLDVVNGRGGGARSDWGVSRRRRAALKPDPVLGGR